MKKIVPDTILIINSDITIKPQTHNLVKVFRKGVSFDYNSDIFPILKQFSYPCTLRDATRVLGSKTSGIQDWINLTSLILNLADNNILIRYDSKDAKLNKKQKGRQTEASIHIMMLNDKARTQGFIDAIKKTVKKGDIVLDIGTGTGILAMTAALCGANHVYAIESSAISDLARFNIQKNGLEDTVTVIDGLSTQVDLPKKADVVVSEMIGNEPLGENILEIFSDSVKRNLKNKYRTIPQSIKIYALAVEVPRQIINTHFYKKFHINNWKTWYGLDFSSMLEKDVSDQYSYYINAYKAKKWNFLSNPALLTEINLQSIKSPTVQSSGRVIIKNSGVVNGFLIFFEARLCKGITINSNPIKALKSNHWLCKTWLMPKPSKVKKNQVLKLNYSYNFSDFGARLSLD